MKDDSSNTSKRFPLYPLRAQIERAAQKQDGEPKQTRRSLFLCLSFSNRLTLNKSVLNARYQ